MRRTFSTDESSADRGFTLVEVLVASLIFAIGMIGAIAMQYAALGGFASSRDVSRAADVGERVIHLLKQESQQWRTIDAVKNDMSESVYEDGSSGPGYLVSGSILNTLATGTDWTWQTVFTEPVDVRLSDAGNRRYCAYLRGEAVPNPTKTTSGRDSGIYRIQVAVVYPGPNRVFPGGGEVGECDQSDITDHLEPQQWDDHTASDLETSGYRAVFMGTHVILRNFLTEGGTYGA
jgi:prepilin-type N-terminal cleavage/methylation domain-containing protein